jgi:hypothetical protein
LNQCCFQPHLPKWELNPCIIVGDGIALGKGKGLANSLKYKPNKKKKLAKKPGFFVFQFYLNWFCDSNKDTWLVWKSVLFFHQKGET